MKNVSLRLIANLILHIEYLCLVGLILFTDGHIPVRLVNPSSSLSNPFAGRLEVRWYFSSNGEWGTVCDNNFTDAAARVVCTMLGFTTGSFIKNAFGPGSGGILLDDVRCTGSETSISSCSHSSWKNHNCENSKEVSISCDKDECATGQSECNLTTTTCVNTIGSYRCDCRDGYRNVYRSRTSITCSDIDECYSGQFQCDSSTTSCVNTVGSYRCQCRNGYESWNSTSCRDLDECSTGQYQCSSSSTTCVNTVGSYRCQCRDGYQSWTFTTCTDINECNTWSSPCDYKTTNCVNTVGSYLCQCKSGYENSGNSRATTCIDINECTNGQSQCDAATSKCVNTVGSYNCPCREGFKYSNLSSCTDINECIRDESECDLMSTDCINTIGKYTCSCKDGFTYLNETTCIAVKESPLGGFGIGAIVGSSVGAFLVLASVAIVVLVFYWKRRKEVNQPSQRQCFQVDNGSGVENNYRNPSVENNCGNPIIYMELDQTALGMGRKTINNTQMESSNRLPVQTEKPKETAQSPVYGNVQSSIYATIVSSVDDKAQSAIYGNVQY